MDQAQYVSVDEFLFLNPQLISMKLFTAETLVWGQTGPG